MAGNPKHEWWSQKAPQVYARFAGGDPDSPPIWLPDGAADLPAPEGVAFLSVTAMRGGPT